MNWIEEKMKEFEQYTFSAQTGENHYLYKMRADVYPDEIKHFIRTALQEAQLQERKRIVEWATQNAYQPGHYAVSVNLDDLLTFINR